VQETVDAIGELSDAGFGLGAVVVNQVREPLVDEVLLETAAAEPERVAARVRDDLAAVGVRAAAKTVSGLLGEAHDHAARVELERSLTLEVAGQGLPTLTLPVLASGIEDGGIAVLADELIGQGVR
jgi:hypothetical protein